MIRLRSMFISWLQVSLQAGQSLVNDDGFCVRRSGEDYLCDRAGMKTVRQLGGKSALVTELFDEHADRRIVRSIDMDKAGSSARDGQESGALMQRLLGIRSTSVENLTSCGGVLDHKTASLAEKTAVRQRRCRSR